MAAKKEKIEAKEPRYIVVSSPRGLMLQDLVNEKIIKGYQPIGGINVVAFKAYDGAPVMEFHQAMIRPENYF